MGNKSILVIASYGGARRNTNEPSVEMLDYNLKNLKTFKHNLDKIVVVRNGGPFSEEYENKLREFDNVIYRSNLRGSYGAWKEVWDIYGDEYEWYFLQEDDYVWMLDNWDSKLKELWEDNMGYLCALKLDDSRLGAHVSHSGGLISANGFKAANFEAFERTEGIYDPNCQIEWGQAFVNSPLKVESIIPRYEVPFFNGNSIWRMCDAPVIHGPIQMYKNYVQIRYW